jgi:hypothetical protein
MGADNLHFSTGLWQTHPLVRYLTGFRMIEDIAMAVSTGAAGNIVANMLNGRVDALRAQVTKIFRHGTEQERSVALRTLDHDVDALSKHNVTRADLINQWRALFLSYLAAHPEARTEIESFMSSRDRDDTTNIGYQIHVGSGPQVGRDNYGSMTFGGQG